MRVSFKYYMEIIRILLKYYRDIFNIGGKDATLPWADMTFHWHWCVGHPTSTGGKDSPLLLVEGQAFAIGGKGISSPLVGRPLRCHLVCEASRYHWWEGHPIAIWWAGHPICILFFRKIIGIAYAL